MPPRRRRRRAAAERADQRIQNAAQATHTDSEDDIPPTGRDIINYQPRKCVIGDTQHDIRRTRLVAWQKSFAVGTNPPIFELILSEDVMNDETGEELRHRDFVWKVTSPRGKGHLYWGGK